MLLVIGLESAECQKKTPDTSKSTSATQWVERNSEQSRRGKPSMAHSYQVLKKTKNALRTCITTLGLLSEKAVAAGEAKS